MNQREVRIEANGSEVPWFEEQNGANWKVSEMKRSENRSEIT
jgi:hypothetical protein